MRWLRSGIFILWAAALVRLWTRPALCMLAKNKRPYDPAALPPAARLRNNVCDITWGQLTVSTAGPRVDYRHISSEEHTLSQIRERQTWQKAEAALKEATEVARCVLGEDPHKEQENAEGSADVDGTLVAT